jgi:ferric-dicitrate binding protein FerR (iron transport regulator)
MWLRWAAAAAAIVLSFGIYQYFTSSGAGNHSIAENGKEYQFDVAPGKNSAILTLSDGTKIDLDSAGAGNLAHEGATSIKKAQGHLLYDYQGGLTETRFNTISTARGNQYMVELSDGTKVWLNAASSITFPAAFTGEERYVKVSGEAYFEVAKMKNMPFKVSFGGDGEIVVLGTHFNVNSYTDDPVIKTTLIEGSVRVSRNGETETLKPGEQAQMKNNASLKVIRDADVDEAVAWKNGFFSFQDADIKTVMLQLARWYDLDIAYEGAPGKQLFTGQIDRSLNLISVLKILDKTKVRFRLEENRKLVILP